MNTDVRKNRDENNFSDVVLELEAVSKKFISGKRTIQALDGISTKIAPGRITGLIGPDGAGKTTLMRLVAGLMLADTGQVRVLGQDVATDALAIQAMLGYMPQRFGLYEDLTVQENLDLYADLQGLPLSLRLARYEELMRMTGLAPFTHRLAGKLSGGMKQKLGLACTLVRSPQLLLLDEPTVGVDPVSRRELWAIIERQVESTKMSVLLSTAYLDEAERCAEVLLLHDGKLLGQGPPDEFSAKLKGRTYSLSAPGLPKRELQRRLSHAPGVLDALIQGESVRLVMANQEPPDIEHILTGLEGVELTAVPPRFEDSFVELLGSNVSGSSVATSVPAAKILTDVAAIEVKNLTRCFGKFMAVDGLSFNVGRGEVFGLLGANGAGKTTTFRMLCGLLPVSSGHAKVAGVNLHQAAAAARARIGYMSQRFSLYGQFSVIQNLRFFGSAYGLNGARRQARISWALEEFGLKTMVDSNSDSLALGYRQRLAMACALLHEPEILFLDEPTSGVDPLARREFWRRINALAEQGVTVLVTTHFMEEAEYCDRLAIMAAGKILILGSPAEIKAKAQTPAEQNPTLEQAFIRLIETPQHNVESEA